MDLEGDLLGRSLLCSDEERLVAREGDDSVPEGGNGCIESLQHVQEESDR
jgi:hypothetical protein